MPHSGRCSGQRADDGRLTDQIAAVVSLTQHGTDIVTAHRVQSIALARLRSYLL